MASETIQSLNLLDLADETGNIYKSITIIGKRANQVGSQMKSELSAKIAEFATNSDSLEEIVENREQIEIAKYYESLPKPTLIALEEFMEGKVYWEDPNA